MPAGIRRWLTAGVLLALTVVCAAGPRPRLARAQSAAAPLFGYAGWATYYGIEDGVVAGDVMYDGTLYDPADPTIAAASFVFPIHTWLRVCQPAQCIIVQVRDRGLLDENSVLVDLSRSAYDLLFGQLGGKAWVSAYFSDPDTLGVDTAPVVTSPLPNPIASLAAAVARPAQPSPAAPLLGGSSALPVAAEIGPVPAPPATRPTAPTPPNTISVPSPPRPAP